MSEFKIEKDVPRANGYGSRYPFGKMDIGDSFAFDAPLLDKISAAASYYGKRHDGMRFSIRKTADGSYRCWRVA